MDKDLSHIKVKDYAGRLAKTFLYNPLTAVLAVFLLAIGYIALEITPREEDPQISISGGTVIVPAPGLTPNEVRKVIIEPLERKLREIKGIEHIYGISADNVGIVNVMYYIGQNREESNLKLYDKVMQNMDQMPKGLMQPLVRPFDIDIDIPIVNIAFYAKNEQVSKIQLFEKVREIQQKINAIDSVSKTTLKGANKEQYNVEVDINKLKGYHLSLGQIMQAIKSIAVNVPDVKGKTADNHLVIFGVKNAIESVKDVQNLIVAQYMGSPIYLKDVAKVSSGIDIQNFQSAQILFKEDGFKTRDQITLSISKLGGTNAVYVANDTIAKLEEYKDELVNLGIGYTITRDYGQRADVAVNDLVNNIIVTIVIISITLIFFLGWRESLIVTFTVPAILAVTLFIAYLGDQTINRITLFAFLLSLGLLVDAAIIVIENIHRHLQNSKSGDIDEIVVKATDEIGAPTNMATFAIILTMVPMAFVGGMMGEFMKPIPLNVPVALLASLIVAYIFTPYLARKLLKRPNKETKKVEVKEEQI